MSPKTGQKLTDNPKDTVVRIRADKDTLKKLDYLVEKEESDRSKVIRKAIDVLYEDSQK